MKTREEIDAEKASKPAIDVVPPALIIGAATALGMGKRKHGIATADGWGTWRIAGTQQAEPLTHYACLLRHLLAWRGGEDTDPESGLPHLHHAAAQLAIIMDVVERPPGSRALDADVRGSADDIVFLSSRSSEDDGGPPMMRDVYEQAIKRFGWEEERPEPYHKGWFNIEVGDDEPFDAADAGARLYHRCANGYSPLDARPKRRRTDGLTGAIADKDRV